MSDAEWMELLEDKQQAIELLKSELARARANPPQPAVMSLTVSREGNGEPCPACGSTNTHRIDAQPAHCRCLHCANSWGADNTRYPADAIATSTTDETAAKDAAQADAACCGVHPGQLWKHYKGGLYYVREVAVKEDTLEILIIYQSIAKGSIQARSLSN
jgi:hypothetical protein